MKGRYHVNQGGEEAMYIKSEAMRTRGEEHEMWIQRGGKEEVREDGCESNMRRGNKYGRQ